MYLVHCFLLGFYIKTVNQKSNAKFVKKSCQCEGNLVLMQFMWNILPSPSTTAPLPTDDSCNTIRHRNIECL